MNPKTTIVLLVLAVLGIVGWLVLGPADDTPDDTTGPVFEGFVAGDVSELAWSVGGNAVRVRRTDAGFEVRVGEAWARAEDGKVEEILSDLGEMSRRSRIDGSEVTAKSRQDYGLEPAVGTIELLLRGEEEKLLVGRESMRRDTVYAKRPDGDDVLVVDDAAWKTILPITANGLRQRRLVPWVEGDVDRITVRAGGDVKVSGERVERVFWRATEPYEDYLHPERFGSQLFHRISTLEVAEFLDGGASGEALAEYGLAEPRYVVEVHRFRGGDETAEIRIGAPVPDREGEFYLKRAGRPFVSTARAEALIEILGKEANWFRDPSVTHLQFTPVARIESTWQGASFRAELDHGEWHLVEPEKRLLDPGKVDDWIDSLRDADAVDFVDDPDLEALGLADPAGRLVLRPVETGAGEHAHDEEEDAEEEEAPAEPILDLSFSAPGEDGKLHALRAGNESTVYVIAPELAEKFTGGFWRFVPDAVFPDAPANAEVVALDRMHGETDERLAKTDGKWPEGTEAAKVNSVVSRLLGLYAGRWVGPAAGNLDAFGLGEAPFATVRATFRTGEEERTLGVVIGGETEGGRYARPVFDGEPGEGVFVVKPDDLSRLLVE